MNIKISLLPLTFLIPGVYLVVNHGGWPLFWGIILLFLAHDL